MHNLSLYTTTEFLLFGYIHFSYSFNIHVYSIRDLKFTLILNFIAFSMKTFTLLCTLLLTLCFACCLAILYPQKKNLKWFFFILCVFFFISFTCASNTNFYEKTEKEKSIIMSVEKKWRRFVFLHHIIFLIKIKFYISKERNEEVFHLISNKFRLPMKTAEVHHSLTLSFLILLPNSHP
jgi:hypothetical protein